MIGATLAILGSVSAAGPDARAGAPTSYFPASFAEATVACPGGGRTATVSDFENRWYSRHLAAAGEPILFRRAARTDGRGRDSLRFTWLRSFHAPVVIRIEALGSAAPVLIATRLSGAGGHDPGRVAERVERRLTAEEADRVRSFLAGSRVFDGPPAGCSLGTDGAQWLIERADAHGYRFTSRWTPRRGDVRELGKSLLGLTGWRVEPLY